jgi:hypothetical protein
MKEPQLLLTEARTANHGTPLAIESFQASSFVTRYYFLLRSSSL